MDNSVERMSLCQMSQAGWRNGQLAEQGSFALGALTTGTNLKFIISNHLLRKFCAGFWVESPAEPASERQFPTRNHGMTGAVEKSLHSSPVGEAF